MLRVALEGRSLPVVHGCGWDSGAARERRPAAHCLQASPRVTCSAPMAWALRARAPESRPFATTRREVNLLRERVPRRLVLTTVPRWDSRAPRMPTFAASHCRTSEYAHTLVLVAHYSLSHEFKAQNYRLITPPAAHTIYCVLASIPTTGLISVAQVVQK